MFLNHGVSVDLLKSQPERDADTEEPMLELAQMFIRCLLGMSWGTTYPREEMSRQVPMSCSRIADEF